MDMDKIQIIEREKAVKARVGYKYKCIDSSNDNVYILAEIEIYHDNNTRY